MSAYSDNLKKKIYTKNKTNSKKTLCSDVLMHFVNFLYSTAVSRSLTPNLKAMPRRVCAKAEPNVVHLIIFPFYPPKGLCKADTEGGPIVFTYVLFCVRNLRMGWMGWDGWDGTEYKKCPSMFFILCGYIDKVYTYLYR